MNNYKLKDVYENRYKLYFEIEKSVQELYPDNKDKFFEIDLSITTWSIMSEFIDILNKEGYPFMQGFVFVMDGEYPQPGVFVRTCTTGHGRYMLPGRYEIRVVDKWEKRNYAKYSI